MRVSISKQYHWRLLLQGLPMGEMAPGDDTVLRPMASGEQGQTSADQP